MQSLTLTPIGFVRTPKCVKFQAGHQPRAADLDDNLLELQPGRDFEQALKDLAGFERIWLIWWFHRNPNWRPQVIPPRGPQRRRGVFATRSPHRPSPIGMTPVQLRGVDGLTLRLGACDLVDGTPVFDIKPYIPAYDSFPESSAGWVDEVNLLETAPPAYKVRLLPLAVEQVRWLAEGWGIEFIQQAEEVLVRDPSVHRTRRISRRAGGLRVLACGAWRVVFDVLENVVSIVSVEPGYPMTFLVREGYEEIPQREALLAFYSRWPDCPLAEVKE